MAGMTPAGLAAQAVGEPWRIVGETDQPAFEGDWGHGQSGFPKMSFRLRGTDDVDLVGAVDPGSLTGLRVFTLPEGYRPSASYTPVDITVVNGGVTSARVLLVRDDGGVVIGLVGEVPATNDVYFINGSFPLTVPAEL